MTDSIKLSGVMGNGYGQMPKMVAKDKDLSIEAKGIYAYMASYAGGGESSFPRVSLICSDLNISEDRYFKHRKPLIEKGYVTIKKNTKKGKFDNNVYILNSEITVPLNHRHGKSPDRQNKGTNNNKVLNNNKDLNSSSSKENPFQFYEKNIGMITPFVAENINYWIDTLSEELVIEAMKRSLLENKRNFNYTQGILKNWYEKNIRTVKDIEAIELEFKNKNNKNKKPQKSDDIDWKNI